MNSTTYFHSIQDVILHRPPMLLLESILKWDETGVEVGVNPRDSYLFADDLGFVPAWVGIEYMAQAISAFSGICALAEGKAPSIGFLLGTRKYSSNVLSFAPNEKLRVKVRLLLKDETNLVLFDCQIYIDENCVATAEIKAIQPNYISSMITQLKQQGYRAEQAE